MLVGVGGLRWDDLTEAATPHLWALASQGSVGSLSVRTVRPRACPVDGWLTVNAGARATARRPAGDGAGDGAGCPAVPRPARAGSAAIVPGMADVVAYNDQFGYEPAFGTLAARAGAGAGLAVGPGAALALAGPDGRVGRYLDSVTELRGASVSTARVVVVDLGTLPESAARRGALAAADAALGEVIAAVPDRAALLIAGLADSGPTPHLRVMIAEGQGEPGQGAEGRAYAGGWLGAPSTRRNDLVQLTDVTPTVLALLGHEDEGLVGAVMSRAGGRPGDVAAALRELDQQDGKAQVIRRAVGVFFAVFALGVILALVAALVVPAGAGRRRRGLARAAPLVVAALPAATFLANLLPWWRTGAPAAVLGGLVAAWALTLAAVAAAGPWRRRWLGPPGVVAGLTVGVLAADVVAGSPLQDSSLLGLSPLVAGRFYGFGNVAFAAFAMAAVFAATWLAALAAPDRRRALLAVTAVGVLAVVADGWPAFGSDFGGVLAMVPGFALLGIAVSGRRVSPGRIALVAAGAVAAVSLIAVLDWLRPARARSHLGRFVQQVLDGDAVDVVRRKAETNLHSFSNPATLLVPVVFVVLLWLILRPERFRAAPLARAYAAVPLLRAGFVAMYVVAVVGFAVNDSGVMVPEVALLAGLPLAAAAVLAPPPG